MITAIALQQNNSTSVIAAHFARCSWFALYNEETGELKYFKNSHKDLKEHAGQAVVASLNEHGVRRAVSCEFGARVRTMLEESGIQMVMIQNPSFTLKEVLQLLKYK